MKNDHAFDVHYQQHYLKGDRRPGRLSNAVLFIHGAGKSDRFRFSIIRSELEARGIGSTAFDCIGHGETGGVIEESSLLNRTRQTEAVIEEQGLCEPLILFGASMGAYNAIQLTQNRRVNSLVLIVPGVYTPEAYDVPFGPQFSSIIRRERSWVDTDAWELLARFTGRLLVIAAENDSVIPPEIPSRLVESAEKCCWKKLHIVKGAEHTRLIPSAVEQPAAFEEFMADIISCIDTPQA